MSAAVQLADISIGSTVFTKGIAFDADDLAVNASMRSQREYVASIYHRNKLKADHCLQLSYREGKALWHRPREEWHWPYTCGYGHVRRCDQVNRYCQAGVCAVLDCRFSCHEGDGLCSRSTIIRRHRNSQVD